MTSAAIADAFADEKQAAQFMVDKIVGEARRQGVLPFTDEERRFLFYDEKRPERSGRVLPSVGYRPCLT